jgi:catechol 2,3-dioxygenase-like lactoylglutathione lyase family enzyme
MTTIALTVGHVGLNVSDLDRSQAFYTGLFGWTPVHETRDGERRYAFLSDGKGLLITLWQQSDGNFSTSTPGLHHLAFQATSMDEVRAFETKLRERGVPLEYDGIVPHSESAQSGGIFFFDPDGIRLEVCAALDEPVGDVPTPGHATCGFF